MPNWSDEDGRYWWTPPDKSYFNSIEIPHPPIIVDKDCLCAFCYFHKRNNKKSKIKK